MTERFLCDIDELRTLFLFEKLSDEQLEWLCANGHIEHFEPGWIYREGELATCFYVLLDGGIALTRRVGEDDVETNRTSQVGVYAGAWSSFIRDVDRYNNSMRVTVPSRMYVLSSDLFAQFMHDWFPMPVHLLEGLFYGMQSTQQAVSQRERLLALGSLSAGLTHELNNPAAAAVRATSSLRERVAGMRHKLGLIASGPYDRPALQTLIKLQEDAVEHASKAPDLSPMEASDLEDALTDWFDEHGVSGGWEIAPTFAQAGLDVEWLTKVADTVDPAILDGAFRWLNYTIDTELMMTEIEDATTRISTLVTAAKQYSQLDRAPFQVVDVHELLGSTLMMLKTKIGEGITVVKDYDHSLPKVPVYAAELNQVWTNLIDNAVDAMAGQGTLTIRTARDKDWLLVQVGDTGPGIPEDIKGRIFEPFFTTKPVGSGTGLGLDISWRIIVNKHHGDLSVESSPGDTRFSVRIPFTARQKESS
ncbi:MAG TPA: ATP-binding protein [Pseudonocardiaceae bacterium]|jgi:signal transduction histidine kinase|nr:ATP-binding protein [Pseudonocardiaceae bacterium]